MVQEKALIRIVWILVQVVDAVSVKHRSAALDAMDLITFLQQQFCEIGTILAGYASNQGSFQVVLNFQLRLPYAWSKALYLE